MEFVNGETLGYLILRTFKLGRRVPLPIAVRIMAWVCEGLHHAHELKDAEGNNRGLVHRDISPHNILVSYDGIVKVTDFGIVKAAGRSTHTRTGVIKGKPQYMSPEQILVKPVDRRADIFALGIVLFETALMKRLFKDVSDFTGLQRIVKGQIPPPRSLRPEFPESLERIILKALAVDPGDRYQTARELQGDLERYLLEIGEPLSTADVADFMASVFDDRVKERAELLTWARSAHCDELRSRRRRMDDTGGSWPTSSSLPGPVVTGQDSEAEARPPRGPSASRWVALALVFLGLVLAVASGFWVARTVSGEDGENPADQRTEAADEPDPSLGNARATPSRADAGSRPEAGGEAGGQAVMVWGDEPDAGGRSGTDASFEGGTLVFDASPEPRPRPRGPLRRPLAAPGTISVIANPWAEVYLGGRKLGRTPLMRVTVPSGRQVLTFLPRGQRPGVRRVVKVRPNGHTPMSVNLE